MRARCARQVPSVWTIARPWKTETSASRGPPRGSAQASRTAVSAPSSRATRSIDASRRAARHRAARAGSRAGSPSRRRRAIAGRACAVWPENHCAVPATSHAQRAARTVERGDHGGGSAGLHSRHRELHVERGGREREHLARALDVRRPLAEQPRRRARAARRGPPSRRGSAARRGVVRRRMTGRKGCARSSSMPLECRTTVTSVGQPAEQRPDALARVLEQVAARRSTSSSSRSSWRAVKLREAVSTQEDISRAGFATAAGGPAPRRRAGRSAGSASRSSAA